ncbi:hypothetical protein [Candidatus Thiodiazotropha sp. CDECU1]|uniref:hypothetical protein n=1 Tax=Candidatus Thiodiazotropha sp. CDECU1 TaxID=3065865 RepID=UPI0029301881|nr:hypothetical protein [Candidatus Thiodiazotropha sp. CDECU1]
MKHYLLTFFALAFLTTSMPALSSTITNAEIDKFLKSVPITSDLLDKVKAKIKKDDALSKKLSKAQLEGKYTREMVSELKAWPEYPALEAQVKQSGFDSVEAWSLVVDRVFGVVSSAQWVVLVASMPMPNSDAAPVLNRDTNLFEFLNDTNNDAKLREKYGKQLQEMCTRMCYDQSDLPVVGARFSEIKSVTNKKN